MSEPIKISDYAIAEEHLANLANEFYGSLVYPAGSHQIAYLRFEAQKDISAANLRAQFLRALSCYERRKAL